MGDKKKSSWVTGLIIALVIISLPPAFMYIKSLSDGNNVGEVRKKMKQHLYEKYGEEFVVDRIGTQTANGDTDYVARIYPKSIVGTKKEGDSYYYAKAGADKEAFGGVGGVGDGYGVVKMNMEAEKYLMPKIKEIFGDRVLMKAEVEYKKRDKDGYFAHYLVHNFEEKLKKVKEDPKNKRLELTSYIYIFNRIEDKAEKEKRRQQIFDFVQYLKDEGLFEYLELGVIFIDERVLAPSYGEFSRKIYLSDKMKKEVEGETIYLPPLELRKQMSRELQKEIDQMSEEELLANMKKIRKSELTYDGIREYHGQYQSWIYSIGMLKERYKSSITKKDKERTYDKLKDVELSKYKKYIYIN